MMICRRSSLKLNFTHSPKLRLIPRLYQSIGWTSIHWPQGLSTIPLNQLTKYILTLLTFLREANMWESFPVIQYFLKSSKQMSNQKSSMQFFTTNTMRHTKPISTSLPLTRPTLVQEQGQRYLKLIMKQTALTLTGSSKQKEQILGALTILKIQADPDKTQ